MSGSTSARVRVTIRPAHLDNALAVLDELAAAGATLRALTSPEHKRAALFVARAALRLVPDLDGRLEALALHLDGREPR